MTTENNNLLNSFKSNLKIDLSLFEGNTLLEEKEFTTLKIWNSPDNEYSPFPSTILFKREDNNPTGSFKDRSLSYELSYKLGNGIKSFAISSSGNAALSASEYLSKNIEKLEKLGFKVKLKVFVSENLSKEKLLKLKSYENSTNIDVLNIEIESSLKPTSNCIKYCNTSGAFNLRASDDDNAIVGYLGIGEELANIEFDSIFTTTSSGTSAIGIYLGYLIAKYPEYFKDINTNDGFKLQEYMDKLISIPNISLPKLYICQTTKVHPIAGKFDIDYTDSPTSVISCVVDRIASRKEDLIKVIWTSRGLGYVISDNDIHESTQILNDNEVKIPLNSTCAFSGLIKSLKTGNIIKRPLIIVSGN
ncbi:MAG: PLP-dependent lyase/thiolase [bacterium]